MRFENFGYVVALMRFYVVSIFKEPDDYDVLPENSSLSTHMFAGACAGIIEHVLVYPVDSVKTRMQCLKPVTKVNYSSVFSGLRHLFRHEGFKGSVKGSGAVIFGAGPAHAAYFGCYETLKSSVTSFPFNFNHANHVVAAVCATMLHDGVMTPADAVKQRLQMYNSPYRNCIDCFSRILFNEGFRSLYRAYFTQLCINVPYQIVHFVCYEHTQSFVNPNRSYLPWTHILSGAIAGGLAAAVTNPLDVCKTLLNTQESCTINPYQISHSSSKATQTHIRGLMRAISVTYQCYGFRGFTRGLNARVLTAIPGTALSWSVYEYFKWRLKHNSFDPVNSDLVEKNQDSVLRFCPKWLVSSCGSSCTSLTTERLPLSD